MQFTWVSGRVPKKPRTVCAFCQEPIVEGYLHELGTNLYYCGVEHYVAHVALATRYLDSRNHHATLREPELKLIAGPA